MSFTPYFMWASPFIIQPHYPSSLVLAILNLSFPLLFSLFFHSPTFSLLFPIVLALLFSLSDFYSLLVRFALVCFAFIFCLVLCESEVIKWFAERADMIIVMFDAHKLDISDELKTVLDVLKPHQDKIR